MKRRASQKNEERTKERKRERATGASKRKEDVLVCGSEHCWRTIARLNHELLYFLPSLSTHPWHGRLQADLAGIPLSSHALPSSTSFCAPHACIDAYQEEGGSMRHGSNLIRGQKYIRCEKRSWWCYNVSKMDIIKRVFQILNSWQNRA